MLRVKRVNRITRNLYRKKRPCFPGSPQYAKTIFNIFKQNSIFSMDIIDFTDGEIRLVLPVLVSFAFER